MITRKLGKLLRGKVTPVQVISATTLAAMLGFMPSFAQTPALSVLLIALIFTLNTNLFVVGLTLLITKTAAILLTPVSFYVGRVLIDGPLQPLFETWINAPVLALFGLEYYVATGGLVVGGVFGVVLGFLLFRLIRGFRSKMATIESDSERYGTWAEKKWVRAASWLMFGKKAKLSYAELAAQSKLGNPIRPLGAAAAVLIIALLGVTMLFFSGPIVTAALVRGLESVNGATVDLDSADVDLKGGKLTLHGLAIADPNQLDTDLIRAKTVEADISAADLLRKRISLDKVLIADGVTGAKRAVPGTQIGQKSKPPKPEAEQKTLEDYIAQAQRWRDRLTQIRRWLDKLSGPPEEGAEQGPTVDDWLRDRINQQGYTRIKAEHLIKGAPSFLIRDLTAQGVRSEQLPEETLDIQATNLSTHPHLVDEQPTFRVHSSADTLSLNLAVPVAAASLSTGKLDFALRGISLQSIADQLRINGEKVLQGEGTFDTTLAGNFSQAQLDLPLTFTLHDILVAIPGMDPQPVSNLPLTLGLTGPMDQPSIHVDRDQLSNALKQAGANELANRARGEVDQLKQKATDDAKDAIGKGLSDLLGKKKKEAPEPKEDQ